MDNSEQPSRPSGERHGRMRHDTSVPPDAIGYAQANVRHAHHRPDQASRYENASQDARQPVIDVVPVEASRQSEQTSRHARVAGAGGSAGFRSARTARASHGRVEEPAGRVTADGERVVRVRKKKKNRRGLKIALITLAVIAALLLAAGVAVALYFNSLNNAISYEDSEQKQQLETVLETPVQNEPYYVLVLGSDAREGDAASRSDVIILARIAPSSSSSAITLVSIPRDTKVELPGYGTSKINAAYAYGGAAGAVEAVENFSGVSISHVVEIHFQELETLIDSLGGVWVNVPLTTELDSGTLEAGNQLLNGEQALQFVRERYSYVRGDFQRSDNQRLVAEAIIRKVLDVPALELPGTIQQLATCVTTDLGVTDIVALVQEIQRSRVITFYSCMAPSTTATIDGVSYAITLEDEWEDMMRLVDEGADPALSSSGGSGASASQSAGQSEGVDEDAETSEPM